MAAHPVYAALVIEFPPRAGTLTGPGRPTESMSDELHHPLTSEQMLEAVTPIVERVVRHRFYGVSLSRSDTRYENERARDCVQQAMLDLWEKLSRVAADGEPPIGNLAGYAARVAHNAVNEVVRPVTWTRLKHRILRILSTSSAMAVWNDAELGRVSGYVGWRTKGGTVRPGSIPEIRRRAGEFHADAVLATHWENMKTTHWVALLERVFDTAQGPLGVNALVSVLAELLDIRTDVPLDEVDSGHES